MKDTARLLAYAAASLVLGALIAPVLYWSAMWLTAHGILPSLAAFEFGVFFRRAVLVIALLLFWPLLHWLRIDSRGLGLGRNRRAARDAALGFVVAAIPLLAFGGLLVHLGIYSLRGSVTVSALLTRTGSAIVVPFIEEPLFRGLILGILIRANTRAVAVFITSAIFSILHFLKSPEQSTDTVTWLSGFVSLGNSFSQFAEPLLVAAGFTTLFLLGWILAHARLRTRSLWLPIGLHAGWIFASAIFNKIAQREVEALPWIGRSLLIGIAPLGVGLISWALLYVWWKQQDEAT